ncbi:MAG: proteasome accessory factor PafA2 family protein [Armatimonadetes bacterium]|nr:proteasome accessory factor PafA2 family protein [Armatimonadota bacterium]
MARRPGDRIFGVETEFGCLVEDQSMRPEDAVELIKDYVFSELQQGAIDLHSRDEVFEPAGSGGFLRNGARFYIDAVGSHLEYATAECIDLKDLVANDRAGQRLIVRAIKELGLQDEVSVYNNSIDHFGGHTFGCHENYLVRMTEDFFTDQVNLLIPFLVTRQIYAGVGRVGGHVLYEGGTPDLQTVHGNPIDYIWVSNIYQVAPDDSVPFQLSQRADHIIRTVASRVRFNRAIINPKWEHYYSHDGMHRLHILFGESNQSEYAYMLKVGTTSLVLRLLEDGLIPHDWELAEPLVDLRVVSRDQEYKWPVILIGGEEVGSVELQRRYLELAERYRDDSEQTNWILGEWASVLDALERDPMSLADRLDWVAKKKMIEMYRESEGLDWNDDALHSIDLEYHNIDPEKSLYHALMESGEIRRGITELDIIDYGTTPPQNTRAKGRSAIVDHVLGQQAFLPYLFDWSGVALGRSKYLEMPDPFLTYEYEAEDFIRS